MYSFFLHIRYTLSNCKHSNIKLGLIKVMKVVAVVRHFLYEKIWKLTKNKVRAFTPTALTCTAPTPDKILLLRILLMFSKTFSWNYCLMHLGMTRQTSSTPRKNSWLHLKTSSKTRKELNIHIYYIVTNRGTLTFLEPNYNFSAWYTYRNRFWMEKNWGRKRAQAYALHIILSVRSAHPSVRYENYVCEIDNY